MAFTDGADPARRPQRRVLAPRAHVGQLGTGGRDVGRLGRPRVLGHQRADAGGREQAHDRRADPAGAEDVHHLVPAAGQHVDAALGAVAQQRGGSDVRLQPVPLRPPEPGERAVVGGGVLQHARLAEEPEQLLQPVRVDAEAGRAHGQPAQVAGAVQALEQPRRAGVEPADDHGAGRVHAELERAAVPPDPPEGRLELGALRRHAGEPGTGTPSGPVRCPQVAATPVRAAPGPSTPVRAP